MAIEPSPGQPPAEPSPPSEVILRDASGRATTPDRQGEVYLRVCEG